MLSTAANLRGRQRQTSMHCRGIWDWGAEFKKELTKEKFKDRIRVTRARDRSVDTKAFTFLREHVKGTRARLERVRGAAKQCIAALRQQAEHACVWAAELELLAAQHWRSGVCVSAIQAMARSLQHAERQRILVIVSAQERMLEAVDMLISLYDAAREEKLRLYWARCALEEAADKVKHYRRKINDGKTNQESKMQGALRDVLVAQRTFQQLNDAMPKDMVQLEAYAGVVLRDATSAYLAADSAALNSTLVRLKIESGALGHAACDPAAAWHESRDRARSQCCQRSPQEALENFNGEEDGLFAAGVLGSGERMLPCKDVQWRGVPVLALHRSPARVARSARARVRSQRCQSPSSSAAPNNPPTGPLSGGPGKVQAASGLAGGSGCRHSTARPRGGRKGVCGRRGAHSAT
jgi:hypothetical protein